MSRQPEQIVKRHICTWLSYQPECLFWMNPTVGIWDPVKGIFRNHRSPFFRKGVSDLLGIWAGKPLAIEVKSKTGRLSDEQKRFLSDFERYGGIAIVARSVDDVMVKLKPSWDTRRI